jgi:inosine/xanthosine triphosphatase
VASEVAVKIALGSKSSVKSRALENVASRLWQELEIFQLDIPSGVRPQPMSDNEAIEGAKNRALGAIMNTSADLGVGLEGSVEETRYGYFLTGWAVVINDQGLVGIAGQDRLLLPASVSKSLKMGLELGEIMDKLTATNNIKNGVGAVGVFTNGLIDRAKSYEDLLIYAFAPFLHPNWYHLPLQKGNLLDDQLEIKMDL